MPPKEAVKKNHAGGDKDSGVTTGSKDDSGKSTRSNVVASEKPDDAGKNADAARATAQAALRDIEMEDASIKEKVSRSADEFEKLFYAYGDQLMQVTQEALEKAKGVDAQSAKAISGSWNEVRKMMQPSLNACLMKLVDSVPDSDEFIQPQEVAHPGMRAVAFRDLLENARADITGSLEDLVKWFVTHAQDLAAVKSMADHTQAAYTQMYNAVLDKMGRDILERMADAGSTQIDFGRDSDYGQALQSQQTLARERDELQLQLEAFQKQVKHLKASKADLYDQCRELQDKFSQAQDDLAASRDKVEILKSVTTFLSTDDANVDNSSRIADLESQLRSAQDANVNLQRAIADYEKQLASGSGGLRKSLEERARDIGFTHDASGRLILGPQASQGFDASKPYIYTGRFVQ